MDVGVSPETVGSIGGAAGLLGLLKSLWADFRYWQDRKDVAKQIGDLGEEISTHTVMDAQTYATRTDHKDLYELIDRKIDNFQVSQNAKIDALQNMIIGVMRDSLSRQNPSNRVNT